MTKPSATDISELLRAHGLRVTPQRRAIWGVFADGRVGHLSADETLRRAARVLPELSRGTVYNALSDFVAAGLLSTIDGPGSQLYDANVEPHDHFRCRSCGKLEDVRAHGAENLRPDAPGMTVERTQIVFEGTCASCAG